MASIKSKQTEKKGLVLNSLVVRKLNRNILDVGKWALALRSADNGRRQLLYDLYENILIDPVLSDAIEKRINAITNAELVFMKDEKISDEIDDLIDDTVMEEILTEIMNSKFWGKTVIELDFVDGLQAFNIPRAHINPEKGIITLNPGEDTGIPYRGDDFFLEAGKDKDFGILVRVAPYAIFKRGGFSDWAQFCELFGIPTKVGKYSAQDEDSRKKLQEAFDESGGTSWLITPKETDIEMKESSTRGDGNLFNNFRKACNEEMLIAILGQTMTTVDGSSRAQSQVHKDVEEDKNKSDRRFVQRILNTELLPRLEKRGFPVKGGWFSFPDKAETIGKSDQIDILVKFQNELGLQFDEDWAYNEFGIPKPADGVTRKPEPDPATPVPDPKKKQKQKEEKKSLAEESLFNRFKERLTSFFVPAPQEGAIALTTETEKIDEPNPPSKGSSSSPPSKGGRGDVFDIEPLAKKVSAGRVKFDHDLYTFTSAGLIDHLHQGFSAKNFAVGIEYGFTPDALKTAMEINLFHFSAGKTLAEVQQLNQAFRESKGWADFLTKARTISGKFNEEWLRTEYDTAVNTAESSAAYHRLIAQKDIFPFWQYITMDDGKVRPEHQKLHLIILPVDDPRWLKIYPPNGWNCRCRIKPLMAHEAKDIDLAKNQARVDDFLKSDEWKRDRDQGWGVNRALTGEVFTANQMYIKSFPSKAGSFLNQLTAETWKLGSVTDLIAAAKNDVRPFTGKAANVVKEARSGSVMLKLYNERTVALPAKDLIRIARNNSKLELYNAMKESLIEPDEIWLNGAGSTNFEYLTTIKYYKDKAVFSTYKVEKGNLILKNWDELKPNTKLRIGLLIKKN
jgi:SPP1 gp7 family putative phage head morphogenesis protein